MVGTVFIVRGVPSGLQANSSSSYIKYTLKEQLKNCFVSLGKCYTGVAFEELRVSEELRRLKDLKHFAVPISGWAS